MESNDAHLDFETYCDLDIRKVGGYRYARHPSCEVLLARYLLPGQDGYPREWRPRTQRPPAELVNYVRRGGKVAAHNASFERLIWRFLGNAETGIVAAPAHGLDHNGFLAVLSHWGFSAIWPMARLATSALSP